MYLLRMFCAAGSRRLAGMMPPGNGALLLLGSLGSDLRLREVARALQRRRHDRRIQERAGDLAQAGVGAEEERLVLADGAAEGAAELVAVQRRGGEREPRIGVQVVVAEELEQRAVKLVAAGARDDVDHAAGEASVFGAVAVGHHAELFHRVGIGRDVAGVAQAGHVGAAIQVVVHRAGAAIHAAVDHGALFRDSPARCCCRSRRRPASD